MSNRCEVICADVNGFLDGKNDGMQKEQHTDKHHADIIWRLDMMGALGVRPHNMSRCSPIVIGDLVYVVTSHGVAKDHINIPNPAAPSFVAINKNTGQVVWSDNSPTAALLAYPPNQRTIGVIRKLVNNGQLLMHGQWAHPAYAVGNKQTQVIFPGGDGWLRAFEPKTGKLLWKFDCNPKGTIYKLGGQGTRNDFLVAPVIHNNRIYIGVGQEPEHDRGVGHLWCIDLEKATKFGKTNSRNDVSPKENNFDPIAVVNAKSALSWHFGGKGNAKNRLRGRDFLFGRTMSTCAVDNGLVFVAELGGYFHCFDANTGKRYWTHDIRARIWCSPFCADGKVYLGSDDGFVYVFEASKHKKLLAENDVLGRVREPIVAHKEMLYVLTESELIALTKR